MQREVAAALQAGEVRVRVLALQVAELGLLLEQLQGVASSPVRRHGLLRGCQGVGEGAGGA